jgi:hypothetical protein
MPVFFLNSALLAAAWAAAVPLLIHLLYRRRARQDVLSTLRFLKAGFAANRRRMRLRHFLVLALRILAILFVVAALARPAYQGPILVRKGTVPVSAVIVLDNSVSMSYEQGGGRSFDRAKQLAGEVVRNLPPGSRAALVVTGLGSGGESLDREFTFNRASIEGAVNKIDISAYGGECTAGLARAYSMLSQAGAVDSAGGNEVYVISDLMRDSWGGLGTLAAPADAATIVLDAGPETSEDFFVEKVAAEWFNAPTGRIALEASVGSNALAAKRLVEVYVGGAKRAERMIELPANSRRTVRFDVPVVAEASGPEQGWVGLADSDPLSADNTRYFTVQAGKAIRCLVVGRAVEGEDYDTGFFLRNALEPQALSGATPVQARYEDWGQFKAADLADADVLILADVPGLSGAIRDAVDGFATSGKGLIIFAGEAARAEDYRPLTAKYFGATLGEAAASPAEKPASLSSLAIDHPMLAAFAGGQNGNLAAGRFYKWRKLAGLSGQTHSAVELARFDSGDAAIVTAAAGAGRAVLAAFGPTRGDSDLVLRASFVPLVNEMARYAAGKAESGSRGGAADFTVGDGVSFALKQTTGETRAEVSTPLSGRVIYIAVPPGAGTFVYRPFFPGNYTARVPGAAAPAGFSANVAAAEFAFDRVTPKEITAAIAGAAVAKDLSDKPLKRVYGKTRGARELFDFVLVAAILLLAVEEYIANRFYRETLAGEQ